MTAGSDARRRLLEARLAGRSPVVAQAPEPIPARPPGPTPLSPGQAALLYEYRLAPDRPGYNVVHSYTISGPLDLDRFERALLAAVARHEPLRTSFATERCPLPVEQAVQMVEVSVDGDEGFHRLARREAATRLDLERGPLVRATLSRLGADRHGLVLTLHHVSSDAASLANLWRDIDTAYRGEPLPALSRTYGDVVAWQQGRVEEADHRFWAEHLGADPQPVVLALPAPTPPEPDGYTTVPLAVDAGRLRDGRLRPVSFFLGLLTALLQRYDDTDDVIVGLAASTRDHPAAEPLVGYFLTVLPLRFRVDPASSPTELAAATDAVLAAALAHRHVPYAEIASGLRRRGAAVTDPARVMFVFDEPHQAAVEGCGIDTRFVHNGVAVTDLTVFVRSIGEGFEASVEWDGARYRRADVEALLAEYAALAAWAQDHPASPVLAAPAAPDATGPALSGGIQPVPALIDAQARRRPGSPAVRCGSEQSTYEELDRRVAALAGGLADRGVQPGARVGVLLARSVDLVAVILAVHRCGAAYVPLDPAYPDERLVQILTVARPLLTVTDGDGTGRVERAVTVEDLRAHEVRNDGTPASTATVGATLEDPAYVIFTSGSTGTPRGVEVRHRQLAASTLARLDRYPEAVTSYLLVSSFGFDSSVAGLFWTLAGGGELVLPTEDEVHDVDALGRLAGTVSHLLMVPRLYQAVLERAGDGLGSLRRAIVAGEACPAALVTQHHRLLGGTSLTNEYGPTETTVWATSHDCVPGEEPVPIGTAVPGAMLRVVDRWLRPRPAGCAGELAIGGLGLTDGYVDDPAATTRSFVVDRHGRRFYRSGDLVRRGGEDTFEFLGRVDHQLSVDGVRIEPEEIEAALLAEPAVTGALVRRERRLDEDPLNALGQLAPDTAAAVLRAAAAEPDPARALAVALAARAPGTDVLVAYVEGSSVDVDELGRALRRRLPASSVPSVIETVAALPRSEHGKIDRRALPPPLRLPHRAAAAEPTGHLELFTAAWRRVLGRDELDADSDFFTAGGDSLLAVELVSVLETQLGRRVPISALVEGRTPRRLAALVHAPAVELERTGTGDSSLVVPLRPYGERPPLVILPPGGGNLIVFDAFVQAFDERYPVLGLELPGARRDDELPASIEELCERYLPQLRAVQRRGPYRFLGWSFGGVVALALAQRLVAEGDDVELVAMIDTLVPGLQRAGRLKAYAELARDGDVAGITRKLRQMVQVRLALATAHRRGVRAAEAGGQLTPADRNTWLTIKVDEIVERHRAQPYDGKVVFFSAQDTYAWRTTEPWRRLLPNLDIVPVDGKHIGPEGLLNADNSARIAAEVAARLS